MTPDCNLSLVEIYTATVRAHVTAMFAQLIK